MSQSSGMGKRRGRPRLDMSEDERMEHRRQLQRKYYRENRERYKEYNRKWRENNLERAREQGRKSQRKRRERFLEELRKYQREYHREWRKKEENRRRACEATRRHILRKKGIVVPLQQPGRPKKEK